MNRDDEEQEAEAARQLFAQPAKNPLSPVKMQITERHFAVTSYSNGKYVQVYVHHSDWEWF